MKICTFIIFFLILFFFCSCDQPKQFGRVESSQIEEIVIDAKDGLMLPIDSFVKKVDYIKLETTNDNLIGEVSQLLFMDTLLVVVDARIAKSICVFDLEGRFKYKIGSLGGGPDEYANITNVCLVPGKDQLSVLDGPQKKVIYYRLTGEYEYSEKTPFMLYYFEYLESGFRAFNTSAMNDPTFGKYIKNTLIVTDDMNKITYGACHDFYSEKFNFTSHRPLRKFDNEVYYSPSFTDTIYVVTDTIVSAKYSINIKWNGMPKFNEKITNEIFNGYCKEYFYFNGHYIELKDLTFVNISTPGGTPFVIYSHKTKKNYLSSGNVYNPFFAFLKNNIPIAGYKDSIVVSDIKSYHIMASKQNLYQVDGFRESLNALYEDLTEDSNPVLFFFHLNTNL